jgi:large subunit ribosomal protein L19
MDEVGQPVPKLRSRKRMAIMRNKLMAFVEEAAIKKDLPDFRIGDQVDVHQRILEGTKERIQVFGGVVIARRGDGLRETFTVRRIVQGEGVERIFPVNSPKIAKIEVKRTGRVRRAKLYYLRKRVGKATRLRERGKAGMLMEGAATPEGETDKR